MHDQAAAEYDRRAQQHRPTSQAGMAAAVQQLRAQGLRTRDIAGALGLDIPAVLAFTEPRSDHR